MQFLYPEQISVPAGKPFSTDLHFRVDPGLHINSHSPHEKSLIPTNLLVVEEPGLKVQSVDFPVGAEYSFAFSPAEKLSIYSDQFVLRAHLTAERGEHLLQGVLRYQACDSNSCYPPKTIPVAIDVIAK
ncbi:MAG TPA: protein-disulfide reductase DsbD domain-containing protein [Acidisarcina sp.]